MWLKPCHFPSLYPPIFKQQEWCEKMKRSHVWSVAMFGCNLHFLTFPHKILKYHQYYLTKFNSLRIRNGESMIYYFNKRCGDLYNIKTYKCISKVDFVASKSLIFLLYLGKESFLVHPKCLTMLWTLRVTYSHVKIYWELIHIPLKLSQKDLLKESIFIFTLKEASLSILIFQVYTSKHTTNQ